jgi:hypothetical protein
MGITMGIDDDGFSAALGGGVTKVQAYLGRDRTGPCKYGKLDAGPFKSILRTTPSQTGGNSAAQGVGMQLVL